MVRSFHFLALLTYLGLDATMGPLPACAARAKPASAENTGPVRTADASRPQARGMMGRLNQTVLGQPVIAVGYGDDREDAAWSEAAFEATSSLPDRLRLIAARHSPKEMPMIPFRIGKAWVIAPERMEVPRTDWSRLSTYQLASRGDLATNILVSLSPDQMRRLGTPEGLPVRSLSPELRAMAAAMFRVPFRLYRPEGAHDRDEQVLTRDEPQVDFLTVNEPPDLNRARLRGYLRVSPAYVKLAGMPPDQNAAVLGENRFDPLLSREPIRRLASFVMPGEGGMELPDTTYGPNRLKPSHLEASRLVQTVGMRGVWTLGEVAAQIEKVAGVRLYVGRAAGAPVFLGSESLRCGDVLEGIRLALTNTWRRLDDGYVLAYDLRGLGAHQQEMLENTERVSRDLLKLAKAPEEGDGWDRVATHMRFHPDDPLALTAEQRARLFAPPEGADRMPRVLTFDDLTEGQRAYLRTAAVTDLRLLDPPSDPSGAGGPAGPPLCTEDDIRTATISDSPTVVFVADLPGHGVVDLGVVEDYWPWSLYQVKLRAQAKVRAQPPTPVRLPASVRSRALMTPALRSREICDVTAAMKRQGFDTLFYPALFGGYSTFESRVFPRHPSLGGRDGWVAAADAAKRDGIGLVGYISCLLWQNTGDRPPWLDRHPDWVDRDILGRSRLEWIAQRPDFEPSENEQLTAGNYVRVREPSVTAKLKSLLTEFSLQPGARGILLTEWNGWRGSGPPLGFTLPDRVAMLRAVGVDPVDEHIDLNQGIPGTPQAWEGNSEWREDDPVSASMARLGDPHERLAGDLLAQAKALRKDWTTYVMVGDEYPDSQDARVLAQPEIRLTNGLRYSTDPGYAYSVSLRPRNAASPPLASWLTEKVRAFAEASDDSFATHEPSFLVLDARAAPGDILEALRWVAPPGINVATDRIPDSAKP